MGESSNELSDIEKPEYLRGQIAGLQKICALLITRFVPLEERGEFKTLLDSRSRPTLEGDSESLFFQGLADSFVKTSDDLWV